MAPLKTLIKSVHLSTWACVLCVNLPSRSSAEAEAVRGHIIVLLKHSLAHMDNTPTKDESWLWNSPNAAVITNETASGRAGSPSYKVKRKKAGRRTVRSAAFGVSFCVSVFLIAETRDLGGISCLHGEGPGIWEAHREALFIYTANLLCVLFPH